MLLTVLRHRGRAFCVTSTHRTLAFTSFGPTAQRNGYASKPFDVASLTARYYGSDAGLLFSDAKYKVGSSRFGLQNDEFSPFHLAVRYAHSGSDDTKAAKSTAGDSAGAGTDGEKSVAKVDTTGANSQLVESRFVRFRKAAKRELLHYWHGAKLLGIDIKIATGLLIRIMKGEQLTRRERKQLARTTGDLFRLVPFSVFVIVPFLEFTLPIFLKLFPNMLPSTFAEEKNELKSRHRALKMKLEMAKFLQDTLEQTAAVKKTSATPSTDADAITVQDFANFMQQVRTSGKLASPEEIKKFSKVFEDELTLDTMSRSQLLACCKLLEISALGPTGLLRHRLRVRLRELEADDLMILNEGVESLTIWELQSACRERGMRSTGVSELRLRSQLHDWLTLNIRDKMPTTLLLLSRAMYLPENLPVEDQLTKVISLLPDIAAVQAQLRASEQSGEVSNTLKIEVIRKEQEAIATERAELQQAEAVAKAQPEELSTAQTPAAPTELKEADTANLELAIEQVASKQHGAAVQQAELAELKQDIREYKDELKSVLRSDTTESKVSQRLTKRIDQLINQVDSLVEGLQKQKQSLAQEKTVAVDDLLRELAKLQQVAAKRGVEDPDRAKQEAKWERILQVVDYDHDGQISVKDAVKLVDMLRDEKLTSIGEKDVAEMVEALRQESELEQASPKIDPGQQQKKTV